MDQFSVTTFPMLLVGFFLESLCNSADSEYKFI